MKPTARMVSLLALTAASVPAMAASTVNLPIWVCSVPDTLLRSGFQPGEWVPHDPSNGSGGSYPGKVTRTLHIAGLGTGTQNYYVYVPPAYVPGTPAPLLIALHGLAPWSQRDSYASTTRNNWIGSSGTGRFIVAAPVADDPVDVAGSPGASWLVPPTVGPNDYDLFAAILADMKAAYNIEQTRVYGWGFSAGAHVMHDLALNGASPVLNARTLAAYGVSAGGLQQLACAGMSDLQCSTQIAQVPRRLPVDIHLGATDPLYTTYGAGDDAGIFADAGWVAGQNLYYTLVASEGHTYSPTDLAQIWSHLCPYAVIP